MALQLPLSITKDSVRLVFSQPSAETCSVEIGSVSSDFSLVVMFLRASLIFIYNELDENYTLNLSTCNSIHGLTHAELQRILAFYGLVSIPAYGEPV